MSVAEPIEKTPEEADLSDEQVLEVLLRRLADGPMTFNDLARAVEQRMGEAEISAAGKQHIRLLLERDGVNQGFLVAQDSQGEIWTLTPKGKAYYTPATVEAEEVIDADDGAIGEPFDPAQIRVTEIRMTVFQVMRKIGYTEPLSKRTSMPAPRLSQRHKHFDEAL